MHYIYLTTNIINDKKYIGQRIVQKKGIDKDNYLGSGTALLNAIKKYGRNNFKKDILYICRTYKQADFLETLEISKRDAVNDPMYYNIQDGGLINRSKNYSDIVSSSMTDYYSNDLNYTNSLLKHNRKKYIKGIKQIEITTIAQRDICNLKNKLIKENNKRNRIKKNRLFYSTLLIINDLHLVSLLLLINSNALLSHTTIEYSSLILFNTILSCFKALLLFLYSLVFNL